MKKSNIYKRKKSREKIVDMLYRREESGYKRQIDSYYDYAMDQIQKEIDSFYSKYATAEGISLAEARRRVSAADVAEYARKAKQYVRDKNFTEEANEALRLYNATANINRLELLKAKIGLETVAAQSDTQKYMESILKGRAINEIERQTGMYKDIMGPTPKDVDKIVNKPFSKTEYTATWDETFWKNHDLLRSEIDRRLATGLIQGKSARSLGDDLRKTVYISKRNAEMLMRTEMTRVRADAQIDSFVRLGYDEYMYLTLSFKDGKICQACSMLDGKVFKIEDAEVGKNLPPMHPNCRCSVTAYEDDEEYEKWLNDYVEGKK